MESHLEKQSYLNFFLCSVEDFCFKTSPPLPKVDKGFCTQSLNTELNTVKYKIKRDPEFESKTVHIAGDSYLQ